MVECFVFLRPLGLRLGEYKNPITIKLLDNLIKIAEENYESVFRDFEYFETTVLIDKKNISTRRRGILVNVIAGIDRIKGEIVFLVYGSSLKIVEENNILVGLLRQFPITKKFPIKISKISYWNLSKGELTSIETKELKPVDKESLINAASRIVAMSFCEPRSW